MTNPQVQKKECLLKSLLHFINKSLLQLDYINAYLFIKIYNYSMDRSKIISELGSDQDDFDSQPTQSYLISSLLPKKKSKIQQLMLSLTKTHSELRAIMRKSNLKEEDILVAFNRGLKILHSVDGKELLQKGKEFFEISQIIAFQLEDYEDIQPQFQQLKKQQFREKSEAKQKQEQKLKNAERQKGEERVQQEEKPQDTQKTVKKVAEKQKEEKKQVKENKPSESGKKVQQKPPVVGINGISPSQEKDYLNNKYAFENSTDAFEQKVKSTERKVQQKAADKDAEKEEPEFFLPILWEIKADCGLKITDREIKKISPSSKYENICANKPFQNAQTYRIKFKVIQYGTLAIGLLPSPYKYKSQKCVNVEKQQALKYIAFQNGGGLIQCGSQTLLDSPRVGLQNNMELEMIYNSKDQKVTFKSERLGSKQVKLPEMLKHYNMYLYFQMKQQHTCVRFY